MIKEVSADVGWATGVMGRRGFQQGKAALESAVGGALTFVAAQVPFARHIRVVTGVAKQSSDTDDLIVEAV